MEKKKPKYKIEPFVPKENDYMIWGEEEDNGDGISGTWLCHIYEAKYLPEDKVLRIKYVSDTFGEEHIKKYVEEKHKNLDVKEIKKIYFDEPWHFTDKGCAYGIILVIF